MDKRCPRQLNCSPDTFCPLAVQRLKALRHAGRELSEEEISLLPGCPWAINHQLANYCVFKFYEEFMEDGKSISEMEVAHYNSISVESVRKIEKRAIQKLREAPIFKEIADIHSGDKIMDDLDPAPEWEVPT